MTKSNAHFSVTHCREDSPLLEDVLRLHAANKSTLGVFPKGAFEEAARQNRVMVAEGPDKNVAGYLVYRVAKDRAAIAHLTTSKEYQGKGVARALIDGIVCYDSAQQSVLQAELAKRSQTLKVVAKSSW